MSGKGCVKKGNAVGRADLHGGHIWKTGCMPQSKENTLKVGDPLGQSAKRVTKGRTQKSYTFNVGESTNMRKAVMNNFVEEWRNKLYVQKLEKNLNNRLREIDREMAQMDKFLAKVYKTTSYFPNIKFWWD